MTEMLIDAAERDELIAAFMSEADETLGNFEELLLRLELAPDDETLLPEIFRAAHTIKGNAACLQFEELTALAHVSEELLDRLRQGHVQVSAGCITRLLDAVDAMRQLVIRSVRGEAALTDEHHAVMQDLLQWTNESNVIADRETTMTPAAVKSAGTLRVGIEKLDR